MFEREDRGVLIKCVQCGQDAYSKEFVLDADYGRVVCTHCIKMKSSSGTTTSSVRNEPRSLPPETEEYIEVTPTDYDEEDKYLEKASAAKQQSRIYIDPAGKATCKKCGYKFRYNPEQDVPRICPYCSTRVGSSF